jgi:hypothetical protein
MGEVIFDLADVMARRRLERDGERIKTQVGDAVMASRIVLAEDRGRREERKKWTPREAWLLVIFGMTIVFAFLLGWFAGASS